MMSFITSNWEWILLALYVVEKAVKLSPSTKDDVVFDMVLKPIFDKFKKQENKVADREIWKFNKFDGGINSYSNPKDIASNEFVDLVDCSISKTGVIDTNKMQSQRYNEDLFKRVTTIPGGKNHGLIMFVDFSLNRCICR